jgi:hypothetical protein
MAKVSAQRSIVFTPDAPDVLADLFVEYLSK